MTEVMRSKLFYARSAVLIAVPTFCRLDDLPSKDTQGILRHLLAASAKELSSILASFFSSSETVMAQIAIEGILAKGRYASQEYFGR
jgi:hypothetical protein